MKSDKLKISKFAKGVITEIGNYEYKQVTDLQIAIRWLAEKYPGRNIQVATHTNGDYVELRCGDWKARLDNTFLASENPRAIAHQIEGLLHLDEHPMPKGMPKEYNGNWNIEKLKQLMDDIPQGKIVLDNKTEAERFADEWFEKHG